MYHSEIKNSNGEIERSSSKPQEKNKRSKSNLKKKDLSDALVDI